MTAMIGKRLVALIPVWLGITLLAFSLGRLAPGDPAYLIAAQQSDGPPPTALVEQIRQEKGLTQPWLVQYARWVGQVLQGDLGVSYKSGGPIRTELYQRFPATLELTFGGLLVAIGLALPLGMAAAVYRGSLIDHFSRVLALVGASLPSFWLAFLLIILFAVEWKLLPVAGRSSTRHLVLPALALGLGIAAPLMRLTRSSLLEVLGQDYIRTARAKGLERRRVLIGHALRNALIPVVTVIGMSVGHLLGGSVIIETIFAWPGIGKLLIDGIANRDYPLIQAYVLLMGTFFILINLGVDLLYLWLDPRIQAESSQ
ncbi:MAG: ABC transporter permease [Caldilineaceae bacterium]|nr:ABC transporter permease [Caldilineaceae bacterium]